MITTKDFENKLNLHPMEIYFIASPEDEQKHIDLTDQLNQNMAVTLGVFRYSSFVLPVGEHLNECLADMPENHNVIVRLFEEDADKGGFYATERIALEDGTDYVLLKAHAFAEEVYKRDYLYLKKTNSDLVPVFRRLHEDAENALRQKSEAIHTRGVDYHLKVNLNAPKGVIQDFAKNNQLSYKQAQFYVDQLWDIAAAHYQQKTVPKKKYNITAEIKYIKDKKSTVLGVEFVIDGQQVQVYPRLAGSKMILFGTLLRRKMNDRLYLNEFRNNQKGNKYLTCNKWMEQLYNIVFSSRNVKRKIDEVTFDKWTSSLKVYARSLSQGKSQLSSDISIALATQKLGDCGYFCDVVTHDETGCTYYDINIAPENIIVPEMFHELLDNFPEWARTTKSITFPYIK